jgi:hypothetical protein
MVKGPLLQAWKRVIAWWRGYGDGVLICQDGAGPHQGVARQEEDRLGMEFMEHPPNSPDLNTIEHCWAWMKKEVQNQERKLKNINEHWERLQALWERMPQSIIDNYVDKLFERRKWTWNKRDYTLIIYDMHVAP